MHNGSSQKINFFFIDPKHAAFQIISSRFDLWKKNCPLIFSDQF